MFARVKVENINGELIAKPFNNHDSHIISSFSESNALANIPENCKILKAGAEVDVEIFDNDISGNGTVNLSIVTYANETEDENYYPHPRSIQVHNNRFSNGGFDPDIGTGALAPILVDLSEGDIPDIFWDGILPISQMLFGQPEIEKLVIKDNGDATFLALNPLRFQFSIGSPISRDIEEYSGQIKPLKPISFEIPKEVYN